MEQEQMIEDARPVMEDTAPAANDDLSRRLEKAREIGSAGEDPAAESLKRSLFEGSRPKAAVATEKAGAGR